MEMRKIALDKMRENDWNPNHVSDAIMRALVRSIREGGFVQPLVVREAGEGFEILDGAHRFRALMELGEKHADCVVVKDSDEAARMRTLTMNRLRGSLDHGELARLIDEMALEDERVMETLAYSEKELSEIRGLLEEAPELETNLPEEERFVLLDFYLSAEDAEVVNRALDATGEDDRASALVKLAKGYIGEGTDN